MECEGLPCKVQEASLEEVALKLEEENEEVAAIKKSGEECVSSRVCSTYKGPEVRRQFGKFQEHRRQVTVLF